MNPREERGFLHANDWYDIGLRRDGAVDLEMGVLSENGRELRAQTLYRDTYVGVAPLGHPIRDAPVTPERLCACGHVVFARRRGRFGAADEALVVEAFRKGP